MPGLHKFSLKKFGFTLGFAAFCIVLTWKSEARSAPPTEIYSTLTIDTIPAPKKPDSSRQKPISNKLITKPDSLQRGDSIPVTTNITDTFNLKYSKDSLDAPIDYEASDSGVLLVKEKKFILYGSTTTKFKDVTLTAPKVELDQATNILTAYSEKDSLGNMITRADFKQGEQGFQSDIIRYNFKTQKGLTQNTYTREQEFYIQAALFKKVNATTTFAKRVVMTTCEYDVPHFGFVANKGKFISGKVAITGPVHPEFEGVPIPIYLPFGIFPLQNKRHSGFLPPQFTVNQDFGLGLEGLGYYHVLNDYLDVTLRGNVYSYGGWSANLTPTYRKRYRYNGALNLSWQHTKFNFKGDPDYSLVNTFFVSWNHSVDSRARPGTSFSANVNAGSSKYNQYQTTNPNKNYQNQLSSSITYSKTWANKPFNFTLSANHNQNNATRLINIILPDAGFTVNTLFPFQRKEMIGASRWYEKLGVGYSGVTRNQVAFYDTTALPFSKLLDTMQYGAQHRFPISMSLPPLGPLIVSPFISYEQTWLTHRMGRVWNDATQKVDTTYDKKGLFIDHSVSFGVGLNTSIYGKFYFKKFKLEKIRHTIRPNLSFNYKPDLSKQYYDVIQTDPNGYKQAVSQFNNNLFSGYGLGKYGGISFGVDNNLEGKWVSKTDTGRVEKKIRLIDGFGVTSGYNFLADSLKLQPFNLYFRTTLFEKLNITAQGVYDPYVKDSLGHTVDRFVWQGDQPTIGRINSGSVSMSTQFQSKPRDPSKQGGLTPTKNITDPTLLEDQQRLQDYIQRNPGEFVDFNIPWSIGLSFSLFFNQERQPDLSYKTKVTSNLSFNNSFSLTPKWNFSTNGYFDINTKQLTMFTMSISRDLHCWQFSANITPIGQYRSFSFNVSPKSSVLQNLKVNRTRYFYNY
jgi:LPS-assembly protein